MRHKTLEEYQESLDSFYAEVGPEAFVNPGAACESCETCSEDCYDSYDHDTCSDGSFSWRNCELCDSSLGGDRFPAHVVHHESDSVEHLSVCVDCYMFLANGDLPEYLD